MSYVPSTSASASAYSVTDMALPRMLSIQSHTVHGYVGNKAAVFPLQALAIDVDFINTVSLCNHPAYAGGARGFGLADQQLLDLVDGLEANELLGYDAVLAGYLKTPEIGRQLGDIVRRIRAVNPTTCFICDPVLGDNGRFYVPEELVEIYKTSILPFANVVTPNAFEAEALSGIAINSLETAIQACEVFHSMGVSICVLKGLKLHSDRLSVVLSAKPFSQQQQQKPVIIRIDVPLITSRSFSGCGDLFSAVFGGLLLKVLYSSGLGNECPSASALSAILESTTHVMNKVLTTTEQLASKELRVINCLEDFVSASRRIESISGNNQQELPEETAHRAFGAHGSISGVIFDMDGTLTEPGAIDFDAMYERAGLSRANGDIITQIEAIEDLERKRSAYRVIVEEEMLGIERMRIREDAALLMTALRRARIRTAMSTRNCDVAIEKFLEAADLGLDR